MLQHVDIGDRSITAYRGFAPEEILESLIERAKSLRGMRVLHVNATPYGGGVSELLRSTVPLLNDLGLIADWKVISGDDAFFRATKAIHNGLQGAARDLTREDEAVYRVQAERNAELLEEEYDVVFVHDPQPAPILPFHGKGTARWVWRCHIDTAHPNATVWNLVRGYLGDYDAAVFTMAEFIPPDLPIGRHVVIAPAIDPLSPKNMPLDNRTASQVLEWIGIRLDRPLVTQVSRFDRWKDPLGVISAYRQVRRERPDVQLALVGSMASDDPEGWEIYREVDAARGGDPMIHMFTNLMGVGNIEVNAFQRLSDVIVQKSTREGFGLVVSEALWKETPVVAARAGGIPLQMKGGVGGVLVDSVEECAEALLALLEHRDRARELGRTGRENVRRHFLIPRLVLDELHLMAELTGGRVSAAREDDERRDVVCGMVVDREQPLREEYRGREYVFCSEECRRRFLDAPARYVPRAIDGANGPGGE